MIGVVSNAAAPQSPAQPFEDCVSAVLTDAGQRIGVIFTGKILGFDTGRSQVQTFPAKLGLLKKV
jgi:hypothetical protein